MFPVFILDGVSVIASDLVRLLLERRAGPDTAESATLREEIETLRKGIEESENHILTLEQQRIQLRREARHGRPTWWNRNRAAVAVNVVAGLIVGVPLFLLGVVMTLWLA